MSRFTDQSEERQVDRGRSQRRRPDVTATEILESMSDGFMALDSDWRITYVNSAAEQITGTPRENLLGRNHWQAFPAAVGTIAGREYRRAMADRVTVRFESFYEPYGRWFEIDLFPVDRGGLAIYGRDITERKQAEDAVRRAHAELEQRVAERTEQLTAINSELVNEVTQRRRTEEELSRANARITEILENITDAFSAWDQNFRIST